MSSTPRQRRTLVRTLTAGAGATLACALMASPIAAAPSAPASPEPSASGSSADATVPGSKTFTIGTVGDMDSGNPYAAQLSLSYEIFSDTYDLLTSWSKDNYAPVPDLATSWSHSTDGLTWTFKLRSGVKWSDGVPMTSADVAYTFNRTITDDTANAAAYNYVKSIKSVEATDPTTVVFHLSTPDSIMTQLWVEILPEHIWKNVPTSETDKYPNTEMIGTGAFTMDKWEKGQFVRLKANKNYFLGAPKIDYLVYREFTDEDAMIQALDKGEIDAVDAITPNAYNSLKGQKNITQVHAGGLSFDYLAFNAGGSTVDNQPVGDGAPAGKDPKFRQAVAYALDLKTLTQKVLQGYGTPGSSIIPPGLSQFYYDPGTSAYPYDPAKAQQLLDAAGYVKDASGFRIDPATHKELNLRILAPNDSPTYVQSVQFIVEWLKDIGIKTTPHLVTYDEVINEFGNAEYDLTLGEWGVEPDPSFQLSTMTCDQRDTGTSKAPSAGWSDSFYCDKAYDDLYAKQASELDPAQRDATVKQMQQLLYTQAPYIVLYYPDDLEAYNSAKWTGIQFQPAHEGGAFFQYGLYTYLTVDVKADAPKSGGVNAGVLIGVVAAVLLVAVVVVVLMIRRRSTADERE